MDKTQADRLPKGTKVRYTQHTRMARGGGVCARTAWGTITGTYGAQYVITTRWGGRTTREEARDVQAVLTEWPAGAR